jgi:alcohol dehydrogenase
MKPIIDSTFDFDQAPAAFHRMASGQHSGKIVIRV